MVSLETSSTWPLTSRSPFFFLHGVCVVQLDWGSSSISASYESTSSWHPLWFGQSVVHGLEKGLALLATNQPVRQACIFKGWASPWWFTAPTETKLGTATVSAPGPLSSSQDELFAEDIQMYKEQIRLTQSSLAQREGKKEREAADFKKTSLPRLLEWVKGGREWKQPCVFKVLIHNLFL